MSRYFIRHDASRRLIQCSIEMVNCNKIRTQSKQRGVCQWLSKVLDMNGLRPRNEAVPQLLESLTLFTNLSEQGLCATRAPPS